VEVMREIVIHEDPVQPQVLLREETGDSPLPALWLRERTQDPEQLDQVTHQRLFNPHLLPEDLRLTSVRWSDGLLQLDFSDGFSGAFDPSVLIESLAAGDGSPAPEPWHVDLDPLPYHDWSGLHEDAAFFAALRDFLRLGFIVLYGTPVEQESILEIAVRFGCVRDTNFGRYFEVYDRPGSNDLAYRALALGPHTDNPYRTPVPGIQLLHCLANETRGGLSTLADSLAVASALKAEDPGGFELLSSVPVCFRFLDPDSEMVAIRPLIEVNGLGEMTGVHYSPKLDELPLMCEEQTRRYHRARRRLGALLTHSDFELSFRLEPGQLVMFDNNRILHGRTSYDPREGRRHLQGCYIDRDAPRSHYRVLQRRLARESAAEVAA
jgi:gamma-butyrobetaine dioxygenase